MNWRSLLVRLFSVLVLLGLALLVLVLGSAPEPVETARSSLNAGDPGWRGWRLMLENLGYPAQAFQEPPGRLLAGEQVLLLPSVPEVSEEQQALPEHDRAQYLHFLERGGTLIAPADEAMLAFFGVELGLGAVEALEWSDSESVDAWTARLETGEELRLAPGPCFAELEANSPWSELALGSRPGEDSNPLVVRSSVGAGSLVLVSNGRWFENESIDELDHAVLAVRLLELCAPGQLVAFDEFALGAWSPPSALDLAFRGTNAWVSLSLLSLMALFVWMRAHAASFPRDPLPPAPMSAWERARERAHSLEACGHYASAAQLLLQARLSQWEQRLGTPAAAANETDLRQRWERLVERRPSLARILPLLSAQPRTLPELEALARELSTHES